MPIFGHFTWRPDVSLSAISSDKTGHPYDELTDMLLSYFTVGLHAYTYKKIQEAMP
jgi:hypothetical protein